MGLIQCVLTATLQLWLQRNEIVYLHIEEGVKGMELAALYSAVEEELDRGLGGLQPEDYYLMETNIYRLRREPIESVRGWLCSIKTTHGDLEEARLEGLRDREIQLYAQPTLTAREMRQFLDWRNVRLNE